MSFEVRILGPLEVVGEHGPMELGGPRRRSVLAVLALAANSVVSIDRLADALYGEEPPATAVTQVQRQVSDLRRELGAPIETRSPGYVLRLESDALDLARFERLAADGGAALARDDHAAAARRLREALALWRGRALDDLADEPFAAAAAARLEDLRIAVLERRLEADLALGAHHEAVVELDALVGDHPEHEGFASQLMLALYRCGRQREALGAYRDLRARLVGLYGIEPTRALRELEAAVLRQDAALDGPAATVPRASTGAVLVCARTQSRLASLTGLAAPLAGKPGRELLLVRLLEDEAELAAGAADVARLRAAAAVPARGAAFASSDIAHDVVRLAESQDADLVVLDAPDVGAELASPELIALLERCPADVALAAGAAGADGRVLVAFAGGEHDWAALEVGAWLAAAHGCELGIAGPAGAGSRALAAASLAVQRAVGIDATPLLAAADQLADLSSGARALVCGLPADWRRRGLGASRGTLLADARAPVLFVHRGPRPGGLAPAESVTRFTWSLAG